MRIHPEAIESLKRYKDDLRAGLVAIGVLVWAVTKK